MKVNVFIELLDEKSGGIYNSAKTTADRLQKMGIDAKINRKDDYDLLHVHTIGPLSWLAVSRAKAAGKPVIIHAHTTHKDFADSFTFSNRITRPLRRYLAAFYNRADLVLAPSEYTRSVLLESGVKRPIKVISNGVDTKRFTPKASRSKIVYCVGHVFIKKGIETFCNTARALPDWKFIWYGRRYTSLFTQPRKLNSALSHAPANVSFAGFVPDIVAAHQNGGIFLFPSYDENQGIVILEAAACGKPIVVRDIPTYNGWLKHNANCLKATNDGEFAAAVKRIASDRKLALRLGRAARKTAVENDKGKVVKELAKTYGELL